MSDKNVEYRASDGQAIWYTADGLATVTNLPAGDYEICPMGGYCYFLDSSGLTASNYATVGIRVPRDVVFRFKLLNDRQLGIYNPAGVDTCLRRVL